MKAFVSTFALAGITACTALTSFVPTAAAAEVTVYGPRPVYVAPARTVTVGPNCVSRTARVWVDGRYVQRTIRNCI